MLLDYFDKKIRKAFSDAALEYDLLTSLHKEIGRELLKAVIDTDNNDRVLDIGMGTGWLTRKIQFYLPESTIVGIDFADGMLKKAANDNTDVSLIQANAQLLPFKTSTFDLIVSNLSLQWVRDLEACLSNVHTVMEEEGTLHLTLFGENTFKELFRSLECAHSQGRQTIDRLCSMDGVHSALVRSGFRNIKLDHEFIKVNFSDMFSLIRWIKGIGANNMNKRLFIGKELLARANDHYENTYKDKFGIYATFEVIWAHAQK